VSRIKILLPLVLLLVAAHSAEPCSCVRVGEDTPEAILKASKLVLLARVTRVEKSAPPSDATDLPETLWPLRVTLVPEKIWKGDRQHEYTTTTNAPSNSCGYSFAVGERYLIYSEDGSIPATQCAAIYRAREAAQQIRTLDRTKPSKVPH
jgi:hypothetical protein